MKKFIVLVVAVAIVGSLAYWGFKKGWFKAGSVQNPAAVISGTGATPEAFAEIPSYTYKQNFSDPDYGFVFNYPDGFTAIATPQEDGKVIVVQNINKQIGVQIVISTFSAEAQEITPEYITSEIPDMTIEEPQPLLVGKQTEKGLAFISHNESFGGRSREVWFVYKGNLYQISTYADQDPFLKGLFATWQFAE